jgi:2-polyprenyl-3-methyl-5-hydroxy-6-metoxy-1,4-benzoquinol methylase
MPMLEILAFVEAELSRGAQTLELDVPADDPRPVRTWVDLAERLRLRLRMPRTLPDAGATRLTFDRLAIEDRLTIEDRPTAEEGTEERTEERTEKYGASSPFARIRKLEDPRFVIDLLEALDRVVASSAIDRPDASNTTIDRPDASNTTIDRPDASNHALRVLDLGINTGDELVLLLSRVPALQSAQLVGVDHSASALAVARQRFAAHPNVQLVEADVASPMPELGRFDLVLSIGLLQSGALDDRELLRRIVQDHLAPTGALILGMPNCRYIDGEIEYGARMKNFTQPELGLLFKDVAFFRKYLQQHHKQVFVTGKYYVFVTAIPV